VPCNYTSLSFHDFFVFEPTDAALSSRISRYDLNCAVSKPNALYGARPLPVSRAPSIQIQDGFNETFTLHSLKMKPLDIPFGYTKVSLRGYQNGSHTLSWDVDFPAGFHDVLGIDLLDFSRQRWEKLTKVDVRADFYNGDLAMDWEFCIDDIEVSVESTDLLSGERSDP
jgi:hypothetical protein